MIDVGKRVGDGGKMQRLIHDLMVQHAREGRKVCRLKGGDPFVFGRGGEEALFLTEVGIPFEIVPGVSSAIAAPGAADIPITHREHAHSFMVMTGSRAADASPEEWSGAQSLIAGGGTLVVLMGLSRIDAIVARLRDRGCPDRTPAAVVSRATFPDQETRVGTLADIVDRTEGMESPAVLNLRPRRPRTSPPRRRRQNQLQPPHLAPSLIRGRRHNYVSRCRRDGYETYYASVPETLKLPSPSSTDHWPLVTDHFSSPNYPPAIAGMMDTSEPVFTGVVKLSRKRTSSPST